MSKIIQPSEFDIEWFKSIPFQTRKRGNQGNNKKVKYKNLICAFDIETSYIPFIQESIMYVWQLQLGLEYTIIGRYWDEYIDILKQIKETMNEDEYVVFYVQNLSYEFQFLRGIYDFISDEVFALKPRSVLKTTMFSCIEYRCAYRHSGLSLDNYTKKFKVDNKKQSGEEFGYNRVRFPWTPLTDFNIDYIVNDVLGLVQALTKELEFNEDNLYTVPLTKTGYVRRDIKKAMRDISPSFVKGQLPSLETYLLCREGFRGGNTHANRYYSGQILKNVKSADRVSSYPDVIENCMFPISQFIHIGATTFDELMELITVRKKAVLMRISMTNVRLINQFFGCPYIPKDKCRNVYNAVVDNGRILSADYLEMTITDIDLKIILMEYDFDDLAPYHVAHARYGKLPKPIRDRVNKYFKDKTELKGIEEMDIFYAMSKEMINSIYGMMAQDPVKQNIIFEDNDFKEDKQPIEDILLKHNKKAFLCYQWGVWTTALARLELEIGIHLCGEYFVYADTDSVKYIGNIDWTEYNNLKIKNSKTSGAYATDIKGKTHYMGVFEMENGGREYGEFITLGAKKYAYRIGGKLYITIAGVTKKKGAIELEEMGGLQAFREGTIFKDGGGLEAVYSDSPQIGVVEIDGHNLKITSNVMLLPSTYTLGITEEYKKILEMSKKELDNVLNIGYN